MPRHAKKATAGAGTPTVAKGNISTDSVTQENVYVKCAHVGEIKNGVVKQCRVLSNVVCKTKACPFFKTAEELIESREKARQHLLKLPEWQKEEIKEKYNLSPQLKNVNGFEE